MPGVITDVVRAGCGKFLLISLGNDKKLVIFDLSRGSIAKVLPLSSEDALTAGTQDHFFVLDRTRGILERYAIDGLTRQTAIKTPVAGVVKSMTSGESSKGPLLLSVSAGTDALSACQWVLLDSSKLKQIPISTGNNSGHYGSYRDNVHVRSASNGKVFGMWATSHSPQGVQVAVLTEKNLLMKYEHDSAGHVVPTPDGMHLMTGYKGVLKAGLNSLNAIRRGNLPAFPTSHPRIYLTVPMDPGAQINLGSEPFKGMKASVHQIGSEAALFNLPDLNLGTSSKNESWANNDFTIDKRVYLDVEASLLVAIPFSNDAIHLHPFDLIAELKNSDIDYFFVSSTPVRAFLPGKTYNYQIKVETNQPSPKFELTSGPAGMKLSETGNVVWTVPQEFKEETADVIVSVSSGDLHQTYESFTVYNENSIEEGKK